MKKKTTVTLYAYAHFNGKYINGGSRLDRFDERCDRDSFEEYLDRELNGCQKSEWCKGAPWLKLLSSEMEKNLDVVFEDCVSINIDFAKSLHRLDVIRNACFKHSTLLGDAILNLTKELTFIVDHREWKSETELILHLEVCHEDNQHDVIDLMNTEKYHV